MLKSFAYGTQTVTIETGELARQADAAVRFPWATRSSWSRSVARDEPVPGRDFFPLTVNYIEKTYAAGKIPGGFFKREGRPTEKETLTSRLIDRPLRPLFPDGFCNEVQVVATVLSLDPEIDPDIPALLGASAALALSGIPFNGPIGAARVGYKDGQYLLNPTAPRNSATRSWTWWSPAPQAAVLMVESEARGLSEEVMLGAVVYRPRADADGDQRHPGAGRAGRQAALELDRARDNAELTNARGHACAGRADRGLCHHREAGSAATGVAEVKARRRAALAAGERPSGPPSRSGAEFFKLESNIVRQRILNGEPRIDGRDAAPCGRSR